MTKLMVMVSSRKMIDEINCDSVLLGIKGLSVNMPFYFNNEEIEDIVKSSDKEIFISINKNIHNYDLKHLEEVLIKLNNLNIKGVLFYDAAILNLKDKLNLNYDLVWAQEHMTTNYYTAKYYQDLGVKYTLLSSEITKDEILEINRLGNLNLIVPIFGYIPMFTSIRHEVKNYLNTFNINNSDELFYLSKEGNSYPLIDNKEGTTIYSSHVLNGINEYLEFKDNNISYVLLNSFNIDDNKFIKVIDIFNKVNKSNLEEYNNEISSLFNTNTGFLNKETIYRVKKDE